MMDLLIYRLFFFLKRLQKKHIKRDDLVQKVINQIEGYYNVFLRNIYTRYPSEKYGLNRNNRERKIVVSLTSFPRRIHTVYLTIETIMRQSIKADKIILWLAEDQFDGMDSLPSELLNLQKRGLIIRFCEDLRSHKKYFYTMQEFPEDIVILFDDDMFYPQDTIKRLLKMHRKYPQDICTMTAQVMTSSKKVMPSFWRNPKLDETYEHSDSIQIFSGSGSLYPPHSLSEDVFNKELMQKLCPYADDLWLTFMAQKNGTKITMDTPWRAFPIVIYGTSEGSLWYINSEEGKNDEQWNAILQYFEEI